MIQRHTYLHCAEKYILGILQVIVGWFGLPEIVFFYTMFPLLIWGALHTEVAIISPCHFPHNIEEKT